MPRGKKVVDKLLDMANEARMARAEAMGFDTSKTWFHGTSADFDKFDPRYLGGGTTGPTRKYGFHFSSNPEVAAEYANLIPDPPSLKRARVEGNNLIDAYVAENDPGKKEAIKQALQANDKKLKRLEAQYEDVEPGDGANVIPAHLKLQNPKEIDLAGGQLDDAAEKAVQQAIAEGHDGVVFKNAHDSLWHIGSPQSDIAIAFKPDQIRSTNAAFDPKKKKSGNILAGGAGAALAAGAMSGEDAEASPEKKLLDMANAARMERAAEMGFDTSKTWYHGTQGNIEAFDPKMKGVNYGADNGYFFTSDPKVAEIFHGQPHPTPKKGSNAEVAERLNQELRREGFDTNGLLFTRMDGSLVAAPKVDQLPRAAQEKIAAYLEAENRSRKLPKESEFDPAPEVAPKANTIPAHLRMKNPKVVDWTGMRDDGGHVFAIDEAIAEGHDGIIFKNASDNPKNISADTAVVFSPEQIRSTNAKFDPAKKNSGNILDFAGGGDVKNPISTGVGDIASKGLSVVDRILGRPVRAATKAAIQGENPITAAKDAVTGDRDTTGEEVAREFLKLSPQLGFPTPEGEKEYPLEKPLGMAADMGLDLSNLIPGKALGTVAKRIKKLKGL